MRKSELSGEQLRERSLFVDRLAAAGWHGLNFNQKFDVGLSTSPEASMEYANPEMTLRCDFVCEDPRVILYLDSLEGKSLGFVFRCGDRLNSLLDTLVRMQGAIGLANIKEKAEELLAACPEMFKISASGDKLIAVKSKMNK